DGGGPGSLDVGIGDFVIAGQGPAGLLCFGSPPPGFGGGPDEAGRRPPGGPRRAASVVAPSRRSLGVAKTKAAAVPRLAIASRRINRWLMALPKPSCRPTRVLCFGPGFDGAVVALQLWSHP